MPPHDQVMTSRCGICAGKGNRKISKDKLLPLIHKHHYATYTFDLHPSVLCLSCERNLRDIEKYGKEEAPRKLPDTNYTEFEPIRSTRSSGSGCSCGWCKIANLNGLAAKNKDKGIKNDVGKPSTSSPEKMVESSVHNCLKCRAVLKKGSPHKCTKTARNENVVKIVRELSPAGQRRVVGKLINGFCEEEHLNTHKGTYYALDMHLTCT